MVVVIRNGQRFSVRRRDIQLGDKIVSPFVSGGAARLPPRPPPKPSVRVSGTTVFIGGKGFSVRPQDQASFIKQRGGAVTSDISKTIQRNLQRQRQQRAQVSARLQRQKVSERAKLAKRIRQEARRRRVDISTRARELRFINQLRRESEIKKEPKIIKPVLEVQPVKIETKTAGELQKINLELGKLQTKQLRRQKLTLKEQARLSALTLAGLGLETTIAFKELPSTIKAITKDPKILKNLPTAIVRSGRETIELVEVSPTQGVTRIAGELLLLKGSSKAFRTLGKASDFTSARLSTKFVGRGKVGNVLRITTKAGKKIDLKVAGRIGSKTLPRETFKQQVSLAGRKAVPVSAQADSLVGFIKRKRLIRKPFLGEEKFSSSTKKLLRKFDERRIKSNELIRLDKKIQKESGKGILERSFFADPRGRIRPSRIGIEDEASLLDILSGDVSLRGAKPQVLVFDKVIIQKFPKSLRKIQKKLRANKPLTEREGSALLKFQLKKSGKFKPIGFMSGEAEVTLAPGEIVKRVKKVGVTLINGKKVPIVEARVIKPKGSLKKNIQLAKKGKLSKKQLRALDKKLKRETGFDYDVSSKKVSRKTVSIKKFGSSVLRRISRPSRKRRPSRISKPSRPSKPRRPSKPSKPFRPSRPGKPSRISKPSRPGKPSKPGKPGKPFRPGRPRIPSKPAKAITFPRRKVKRKPKPKKAVPVFNVFGKVKKKFIKLNVKPLRKIDALSRGAFAVDKTTARTYKIKPAGKSKTPGGLLKRERGYFSKHRKKLRQFKIRKGKKFKLQNKFIEKRRFGIDTRGEKKGLTIAKLLKGRRKVKRKITPAQRKVLLKRLEKARAAKK